jgi:inosine-uridine nucleoside N-ribohydrolase
MMAAMDRINVHLDTDIGGDIDDLCALALLLAWPGVEIAGITTVLEDRGRRAGCARYTLDLAGRRDVPVAPGAETSLGCFRLPEYGLLPEDRYWPDPVPPLPGPLAAALDLLQQSLERGAVIVAIGPVTNLSLLERRAPGSLRRATLCLMGGRVNPPPPGFPDWGYENDFNFQADPAAAKHVLEAADPARTTVVPIEATAQTALRRADVPALRRAGRLGRLLARQAEAYDRDWQNAARFGRPYAGLPDDLINFQHDPLACAVALGWSGATVETLPVALALDEGWLRMRVDPDGRPLRVVTAVDRDAFNALWLDTVTRRPLPD